MDLNLKNKYSWRIYGILHLKETFLKQLKFVDLNLKFKDGYVEDYSCGNFKKTEDNRKYIEENLLFPHKTLPIGEFAIGTNTQAYMMAKKFDILLIKPVSVMLPIKDCFLVLLLFIKGQNFEILKNYCVRDWSIICLK